MENLLWRIGYTYRLHRSPWPFSLTEAWRESGASWEFQEDYRGNSPRETPAGALYEDQQNWNDG